MSARIALALLTLIVLLPCAAMADAGVLAPYGKSYDPQVLRLERMEVRIDVDNQLAHVWVLQIFRNGTARNLEGQYSFIIPQDAAISAFAIWDDGVRIPGVILEKQRARRIYEQIVDSQRDPGLFESMDDPSMVNEFSCRVFPIPAYGTKRIELEYTQLIEVDGGVSTLLFPFKPTLYGEQSVDDLVVEISIESNLALSAVEQRSQSFPLEVDAAEPGRYRARIAVEDFDLNEDLVLQYGFAAQGSALDVLAFRDVESVYRDVSPVNGLNYRDEYGYLYARAYLDFGGQRQEAGTAAGPRHVVLLFDTSLSMQWDKIERALEILELLLTRLRPEDTFRLVCFNSGQYVFDESAGPLIADDDAATRALEFVRTLPMAGGTDLRAALERGLELRDPQKPNALILITDGQPTLRELRARELIDWYNEHNLAAGRVRTFALGVGDDTNGALLENLVRASDGAFTWVMNNETVTYKAERLAQKLDEAVINDIVLELDDEDNLVDLYPQGPLKAFDRSLVTFVGRYRRPGKARVTLNARFEGRERNVEVQAQLPEHDVSHPGIRRLWAKARVDYLLERIRLDGEDEALVQEVIDLSKQFTFITPYTSFLAAPRSLLRPRVIKPGDPLLRVHTDEAIVEVVASFPFGLVKLMAQVEPGVWQTRFLAPATMTDGRYVCRLYLRDVEGNQYVEDKSFVIDSRPPQIELVDPGPLRPGELVRLAVRADRDTRRLTARFPGSPTVRLEWDSEALACIGALKIPADAPRGPAILELFAEDFAHNTTSIQATLEVR
ncbi:MAG: VIT and VWA domain-containing protein [Candidatus Alcyoniella australis]|nr:VIT and VWA domain-containing protein [Candidatus Alcyoniella australis]